ncbi:hypothetical protein Tsubulata_039068 [Turnera subulata]|uniref:B-like cyclin n=1 Tax=Turnera subulata TaxID=218843 RepID=A0A9Q0FX76_9ROSI|nr:hypothetical protein Tsubulata_039068 [Turnera subulata]
MMMCVTLLFLYRYHVFQCVLETELSMEEGGGAESISGGLLCQESEACLGEAEVEGEVVDEDAFLYISRSCGGLDREDDDVFVETLVDREIGFGFKVGQSFVLDDGIKCARLEAIAWILKNRGIFGFRLQTAYLSITYFDRFLSKRSIDSGKLWAVKLLAVACLSLAAKMEELRPPALSELQTDEYNFDSKAIQRMELLVLSTLEWRMMPITPFPFLHYFFIKFCEESQPRQIMPRTVGFIMAITREITLMDHRPSVIAAAATLVALDQTLTRKDLECKLESLSCSGFLEIEEVFQCYSLMQKLETNSLKRLKFVRPVEVLDNSSSISNICAKRRRLMFNGYDQDKELHDQE